MHRYRLVPHQVLLWHYNSQRSALSMALQQQVQKVEESQRRLRILGQRRAELANQDQEPQEIRVKRILEKLTREAQGIKELQDRNGGTGDGDGLVDRLNDFMAELGKYDLETLCKDHPEDVPKFKEVYVLLIESVLDRGEKIELFVEKQSCLNEQAYRFKKSLSASRKHSKNCNLL